MSASVSASPAGTPSTIAPSVGPCALAGGQEPEAVHGSRRRRSAARPSGRAARGAAGSPSADTHPAGARRVERRAA